MEYWRKRNQNCRAMKIYSFSEQTSFRTLLNFNTKSRHKKTSIKIMSRRNSSSTSAGQSWCESKRLFWFWMPLRFGQCSQTGFKSHFKSHGEWMVMNNQNSFLRYWWKFFDIFVRMCHYCCQVWILTWLVLSLVETYVKPFIF